MQIDTIRLKNFRKFEDATVSFHPEFSLLVGENGSGKTAILEALAIVFEGLRYEYEGLISHNSTNLDKIFLHHAASLSYGRFRQEYDRLVIPKNSPRLDGQSFSHEIEIDLFIQGNPDQALPATLHCTRKNNGYLLKNVDSNNFRIVLPEKSGSFVFPSFVYYNISRAKKLDESPTQMKLPLSAGGYANCWTGEFSDVLLKEWFLNREIAAVQDGTIPELEAVRKAIVQAIPGSQNVQFRASHNSLIIEMQDGTVLPFNYLSDGYRNMLSVVADIAHRMARLNPHLGSDVLTETPGVVLIDELDLHLHPKWQRIIASKLREIFPKIQFIATTHSPQIINHVKPGCIRILRDGEKGFECVTPDESYGQTVDAVLEDIMGVESVRPDEIDEKLDLLFEKIERLQLEDAKTLLVEIKEKIVSDPMLLKAEQLIRWKEKTKT